MGLLATHNRQLIYIYSEDSLLGKKGLSYVKSSKKPSRIININRENLVNSIWAEIVDMLDTSLSELLSTDYIDAPELNESSDFTTDDWFKILKQNPSLLQKPIIINGSKAGIIKSHFDFFSFYELDGGDLDKSSSERIKRVEHSKAV